MKAPVVASIVVLISTLGAVVAFMALLWGDYVVMIFKTF